ncbi:beta-lactamase class C [Rhizobium sp. RU20A]|uniref:class C beta-lactamase n=1 Tax=Rhizobium sp. RU20A TaxID=1907412 RepID=UPI0009573746|nr:class C beta-lactamase [Rhizobium sp. RU20A]SIQ27404.1 beta-lactamase class C [Rhizobium sp. RU20A]
MKMKSAAALCLAATIGMATTARADDLSAKAAAAFQPIVKQYDIPGLVIGVTRNGEHAFYATGLASRADKRPATPDTLFELGSVSKIFNVTLAALAEQRGALRLEHTVAQHVCDTPCTIAGGLTLMDLATHHTGGMPLQVPDDIKDTTDLVGWLKAWKPQQPGSRSYSNISIGLLGHITGQAMGMSYRKAFATVLRPAIGLENTWIDVPKTAMADYAYGYHRTTNKPIRVGTGVLDAEAYGVKSSARDMLKLLDLELGVGAAPEDLRKAIARTQEGQLRTANFVQDMIWEQYPWPVPLQEMLAGNSADFILKPQPATPIVPALPQQKDVILSKTGSTNGFGAYVAILPGEKLGVVVLANRNYPNEERIKATHALIREVLGSQ